MALENNHEKKKFNSFDPIRFENESIRDLENFFVPINKNFFNIQNSLQKLDENQTIKDMIDKNSEFSQIFNSKKNTFSQPLDTKTFQNIYSYYKQQNHCLNLVYCLQNFQKKTTETNNEKYDKIVIDLQKKIENIDLEQIAKYFYKYFVKEKNQYINAKNININDKTKPLNYINSTDNNYYNTPGAEINIIDINKEEEKVKVTNIVLHDLTNILSQKVSFFMGYESNSPKYTQGSEKYNEFIKNIASSIVIIKMFFNEDEKNQNR